jgi:azurin
MKRTLDGLSVQQVKKIDGHYEMHSMTPNLRQVDVFGGFTAAAGHNLYTARNFPKSYWNRTAFVCEPTGRVVHNAMLEREGSGFIEKDGWNLLASSDEWVAPVQAEVGPDGAVWIADWYDFIIQHNPTPSTERGGYQAKNGDGNAYINPLRDTNRGRIYRIIYKQAKPYAPIKLSKNDAKGLLAALENDNMFWRLTAQRLLVESKNQTILPGLYKIIGNQKVDEIALNSPAVHALWTMNGLGVLNGSNKEALQAATKALSHPAAGVRKAAVEVLPKTLQTLEAIQKSGLLNDSDLRTRMATMLVISDMPASDEMGRLLYQATLKPENGKDVLLEQALFTAILTHQKGFLNAYPKSSKLVGIELKDMNLSQRIFKSIDDFLTINKPVETSAAIIKTTQPAVKTAPVAKIVIKVVKNVMKYDKTLISVKAGKKVIISFENPDFMQHNLIIIMPGTLQKVGEAADALARNPKAGQMDYVPQMQEVLYSTKLLNPGESFTLQFTAPTKPGDYPFLCTFPGHWRIMNGIMRVIK